MIKPIEQYSKAELVLAAEVCLAFSEHASSVFYENMSKLPLTDKGVRNAHEHMQNAYATALALRKVAEGWPE